MFFNIKKSIIKPKGVNLNESWIFTDTYFAQISGVASSYRGS